MIFILHYVLLNAGLPTVLMFMALFLKTHSDASLSEIGTLLMVLPFVGILIKPLFGALADRHRAHRLYLMGSLGVMALGYGSLAIAPFFPEFVQEHGRLVWYLDVVGIVVGYCAFGSAWSLGDTLAVNGAQLAGVSWGRYRMWAVVSWGVSGAVIGQLNELPSLPAYVAGLPVLVGTLSLEIFLLAVWPRERFAMVDFENADQAGKAQEGLEDGMKGSEDEDAKQREAVSKLGDRPSRHEPLSRCPSDSLAIRRSGPAPITTGHLSGKVGHSLRSNVRPKHKDLDQIMNEFREESQFKRGSLDRLSQLTLGDNISRFGSMGNVSQFIEVARSGDNTQLTLLKLILIRDKNVGKYLLVFTLFGFLMTCHVAYFFIHVRNLCELQMADFALVSGAMLMAHAGGEVLAFLLVDRYIEWCGRTIALVSCAGLYLLRFGFYGLLMEFLPIESAIVFELGHGFSYACLYTLICRVACESVDQVDQLMPELIARELLPPEAKNNIHKINELRASLRGTMQAIFSGAYDGLGNGLGSLFGGLFLDSFPFARLWQVCASLSLAIMLVYPLVDRVISRAKPNQHEQKPSLETGLRKSAT